MYKLLSILITAILIALPINALGVAVSQFAACHHEIMDEWGKPLRGTPLGSVDVGNLYVPGELVHVYHSLDGVIYPPNTDGTSSNPNNVLLKVAKIGWGVSPSIKRPANFGLAISPRPQGNSKIFIRVFNNDELRDSSFYTDSQLYSVIGYKLHTFSAVFGPMIPLDLSDNDGDGLNNSWEKSWGTDENAVDTDGDGMLDSHEVIAGTDPLDAQGLLEISKLERINGEIFIEWRSRPSKSYNLQRKSSAENYVSVDNTPPAQSHKFSMSIEEWATNEWGTFRVEVPIPDPDE